MNSYVGMKYLKRQGQDYYASVGGAPEAYGSRRVCL